MTHYEAGVRAERKAKAKLEAAGYTVLRMAGSHGAADLVAIHPDDKIIKLIQVKVTGDSNPNRFADALDELANLTQRPSFAWKVLGELWVWRRGGSSWTVREA